MTAFFNLRTFVGTWEDPQDTKVVVEEVGGGEVKALFYSISTERYKYELAIEKGCQRRFVCGDFELDLKKSHERKIVWKAFQKHEKYVRTYGDTSTWKPLVEAPSGHPGKETANKSATNSKHTPPTIASTKAKPSKPPTQAPWSKAKAPPPCVVGGRTPADLQAVQETAPPMQRSGPSESEAAKTGDPELGSHHESKSPVTPVKTKDDVDADEVEVMSGPHKKKRGKVVAMVGEGKDMRWRVKIENGPTEWVDEISFVTKQETTATDPPEQPGEVIAPAVRVHPDSAASLSTSSTSLQERPLEAAEDASAKASDPWNHQDPWGGNASPDPQRKQQRQYKQKQHQEQQEHQQPYQQQQQQEQHEQEQQEQEQEEEEQQQHQEQEEKEEKQKKQQQQKQKQEQQQHQQQKQHEELATSPAAWLAMSARPTTPAAVDEAEVQQSGINRLITIDLESASNEDLMKVITAIGDEFRRRASQQQGSKYVPS